LEQRSKKVHDFVVFDVLHAFLSLCRQHVKIFMDNSLTSYFGMKGLIDLRVADILAKQSALHHRAAMEQLNVANHLAEKADKFTLYADHLESKSASSSKSPDPSEEFPADFRYSSLPGRAYAMQITKPDFLPPNIAMQSMDINLLTMPYEGRTSRYNFI
jgi:hypothetical protein